MRREGALWAERRVNLVATEIKVFNVDGKSTELGLMIGDERFSICVPWTLTPPLKGSKHTDLKCLKPKILDDVGNNSSVL